MPGIHRKERENRKRKTHLTHTGLLMEGVSGDSDVSVIEHNLKRSLLEAMK